MIILEKSDYDREVSSWFGGLGWSIMIVWFVIVMLVYINAKSQLRVIDEKIELAEKMNQDRIESVMPILEKYPEMEREIIEDIDPSAFAVLGDVYPDLKSNQSYAEQAELVKANIAKVESLQNDKLDLKAIIYACQYHIWFLK
jgi:hypothetical protein